MPRELWGVHPRNKERNQAQCPGLSGVVPFHDTSHPSRPHRNEPGTQALFQKSLENWDLNMLGATKGKENQGNRKTSWLSCFMTWKVIGTYRHYVEINFFHYTIYFGIILDWQGTCQDSIENSYLFSTQLFLSAEISPVVPLTKLRYEHWYWLGQKVRSGFSMCCCGTFWNFWNFLANPIQFCELN